MGEGGRGLPHWPWGPAARSRTRTGLLGPPRPRGPRPAHGGLGAVWGPPAGSLRLSPGPVVRPSGQRSGGQGTKGFLQCRKRGRLQERPAWPSGPEACCAAPAVPDRVRQRLRLPGRADGRRPWRLRQGGGMPVCAQQGPVLPRGQDQGGLQHLVRGLAWRECVAGRGGAWCPRTRVWRPGSCAADGVALWCPAARLPSEQQGGPGPSRPLQPLSLPSAPAGEGAGRAPSPCATAPAPSTGVATTSPSTGSTTTLTGTAPTWWCR